jgi:protein TonB
MFTGFAEAQGRQKRRGGVAVASVAVHAALAWLAAVATVRAEPEPAPPAPPGVLYYVPPRPEPDDAARRDAARGPTVSGAAALARRAPAQRVVAPPAVVPVELPPIGGGEVSAITTAATASAARALAEGGAGGAASLGGAEPVGGVWGPGRVEVEARARSGNEAPRYPATLERGGVGGRVLARFVVDTTGRVEPGSVEIRESDHPLFADAVRRALVRYRFDPARVGGHAVRQLVELPIVFAARR